MHQSVVNDVIKLSLSIIKMIIILAAVRHEPDNSIIKCSRSNKSDSLTITNVLLASELASKTEVNCHPDFLIADGSKKFQL